MVEPIMEPTRSSTHVQVDVAQEEERLMSDTKPSDAAPNTQQQQQQQQRRPRANMDAPKRQIMFLDGLRGLASLLVVCQHAGMDGGVHIGASAVDIFFVLSSFLLTMLLDAKCRQLRDARASTTQWVCALADYFSKRFLRIYPLYAAVAVAVSRFPGPYGIKKHDLWQMLTLDVQKGYFVFWTLPLEIRYYFLIPAYVGVLAWLGRRWWLAAGPLCLWVVHEGLTVDRKPHGGLDTHLSTFVVGSLAASVYTRLNDWIRLKEKAGVDCHSRVILLVVRVVQLLALALALSMAFHGLFFHWVWADPFALKKDVSQFISLPTSVVLVFEIVYPSVLSELLEWKLFTYAGKVSFSMYLLHPFVTKHEWHHKSWHDRFFGTFILVFLLATAGYWAVEYPSMRLAQRISTKLHAYAYPKRAPYT